MGKDICARQEHRVLLPTALNCRQQEPGYSRRQLARARGPGGRGPTPLGATLSRRRAPRQRAWMTVAARRHVVVSRPRPRTFFRGAIRSRSDERLVHRRSSTIHARARRRGCRVDRSQRTYRVVSEHRGQTSAIPRRDDDSYHTVGSIRDSGCVGCGSLDEEVARVVSPPRDPRERYDCRRISRTTQREARARHADDA